MKSTLLSLFTLLGVVMLGHSVSAFDPHSKSNVVNYWGQNSVYAQGGTETDLVTYCEDDTINIFALAFVYQIENGMPVLNLANHCQGSYANGMPMCAKVGQDIKACQARGKAVVISVGGATGSYSLPDAKSGEAFAEKMWDLFLGGSSNTRPFGDAIVDGVDLDLEKGTNLGYVAFIQTLRKKFATSGRNYYISSAPQCPYPDQATKLALDNAWFDFVWVQFYNNYCGVQSYGTSNFNFNTWNNWATTVSLNKNVRVFLGVPGGPGGAGSGIVNASTLKNILKGIKSYSNFGGVMMWDAGIARRSGLAVAAAKYLHGSSNSKRNEMLTPGTSQPAIEASDAPSTRAIRRRPSRLLPGY
ncbi:glycoside hydrolase family 18 protein [Dissophora ornata]|nr:Chitinase 1 [Dissophora ornata]KAI8596474.1 glycoside hydrolase family 18 protein [Dissophora ornata]